MIRPATPTTRAWLIAAVVTTAGAVHVWAMVTATAAPIQPVGEWRISIGEWPGHGVGTLPPGALLVWLPEPCVGRIDQSMRWRHLGHLNGHISRAEWPTFFADIQRTSCGQVRATNRRFVLRSAARICPPTDDGPPAG